MRCVVPGRSLKLFAKAIQCLSKIGDELYVEALHDGLALRTVNLSRSAYACFKFHSSFFLNYDDGSNDLPDDSEAEDSMKCKIALKSCLSVLKPMNNIEKLVDRCKIDLNVRAGQLVFLLHCKHGITKTHNLTFQECETLQAVFTKDLCPNFITTQPKVLMDTVCNFPNNQEELTLSVTPAVTLFKNYTDDEPDPNKVIRTQMNLSPEEFDHYAIGVDTDITFCLKELRAILAFGEYSGQPVNIHFETGGKPIVFSMDADSTYECDFVLATLVDELPSTQSSQSHTTKQLQNRESSQVSKVQNGKISSAEKKKLSQTKSQNKEAKSSQHSIAKQPIFHGDLSITDDEMFGFDDKAYTEQQDNYPNTSTRSEHQVDKKNKLSIIPESSQENSSLNASANPIYTPRSNITDTSFLQNVDMPSLGDASQSSQQFHKNIIGVPSKLNCNDSDVPFDDDDDDDDNGIVPGTPPSKKFKSMFFGSQSQRQPEDLRIRKVLAADTDDEDSD